MSKLAGKESTATMTGRSRATPARKRSGATPEREPSGAPPHGSDAVLGALERLSELLTDEVVPKLVGEDETAQPSRPTLARAAARPGATRRIRVEPGVRVGPTGRLLMRILGHYPKAREIYITSAFRPEEPSSHHGGLSYKGSPTAAIDIGAGGVTPAGSRRMRDVAKWLYDRFAADTVELIHTTPYSTDRGFYVKHQRKYPGGGPYGPGTRAEHRNHVHFATSKALAQKVLARLRKPRASEAKALAARAAAPAAAPAAALVWGWDASGHDWKRGPMDFGATRRAGISFFTHKCTEGSTFKTAEYRQGLRRARAAGIPVLGAYHVLWPGKPIEQARVFFNEVNEKTPWWKNVPWIWQLDAEKFDSMPRAPTPAESKRFLNELRRLAGGRGWFVAYAPRWVYKDSFRIGYDLWASDYRGSGAPRPFKQQYQGVPASSWQPYSGRKPRVLQFASDATIGKQRTCDANRFDGNLKALIALTKGKPAARHATRADTGVDSADAQPVQRVAAAGYPHRPCRPGGPTRADKALAAKIGRKLRGKLRGAFDGDRLCCARRIVAAVRQRRLHRRAAVIAVTTAIVESTLLNINRELDHDSLGLFQQRASWGSRAQRLNPTWATNAFIGAMLDKYPRSSWMPLPIGQVCQRVQVSAYPDRYQHEVADARAIVFALWRAVKPKAAPPRRSTVHTGASAELAESVRALLAAVSRRAPSN
ncbi:MAG: GH25 family lysozyme, partial [Burkholderiales bacterium]